MQPSSIRIADYTYHLPADRIAAHPLPDRDASKLLVYDKGNITETIYRNISAFLPSQSLMIFNDTKVIEARILFQKPTGGVIEVFCLEPHEQYKDITSAMLQQGKVWWKCMIGGASKWKHGMQLQKAINQHDKNILLNAAIIERRPECFIIEFTWTPADLSFAELLHEAGLIPLPPYIKREPGPDDTTRYQTIYANANGSVAAPTAGLHFTHDILQQLHQKEIQSLYVTLHVGAGTFKPVKSETIGGHEMHAEFIQVNIDVIESLRQAKETNTPQKIIAVGTTSFRTLESLYWMGIKIIQNPSIQADELSLSQWDAYQLSITGISPQDALRALLNWMRGLDMTTLTAKTQLLVAPGYSLKMADILATNFHQPQSTLLLLVAAVAGPTWRDIYDYALKHDFRFLSYGDGCLIYAGK